MTSPSVSKPDAARRALLDVIGDRDAMDQVAAAWYESAPSRAQRARLVSLFAETAMVLDAPRGTGAVG